MTNTNFYPFTVELSSPSIAIKTEKTVQGINLKSLSADLIIKGLKRMFGEVTKNNPISEISGGVFVHEYENNSHIILFVRKDHSDMDLETALIMDEAFKKEYDLPKNLTPKLCLQAKFKSEFFENLPPRYSVTLSSDSEDPDTEEAVRKIIKEELRRELPAFECKLEAKPKQKKNRSIILGNVYLFQTTSITLKLHTNKEDKLQAVFEYNLFESDLEQLFPTPKIERGHASTKGILLILPENRMALVRLAYLEEYALPYFLEDLVKKIKSQMETKGKFSYLATEIRFQSKITDNNIKTSLVILYPEGCGDLERLNSVKQELSEGLGSYGHKVYLKEEPRTN